MTNIHKIVRRQNRACRLHPTEPKGISGFHAPSYKLTNADVKAKFICLDVGITCEPIPTKNGKFRVGVHKHGELIKIRDAEFEYDEQDYALHESYRALSQIINNGSQ